MFLRRVVESAVIRDGEHVMFAEYDATPVPIGVAVELEVGTGMTLYRTVGLHVEIVMTLIEYPFERAVEEFTTAE